jgi:hypothetical protein
MTKLTRDEAKADVANYDPKLDYRFWKEMTKYWRDTAIQFQSIAAGLARDGKSADNIAHRLMREMADRKQHEETALQSAIEKFAKNADDLVEQTRLTARQEAIAGHQDVTDRMIAKSQAENEERMRKHREEIYQRDIAEAERKRNGGAEKVPSYLR